MSDNPLAGLQIPSTQDIARRVVERMGAGVIDLRHPINRERLRNFIAQQLDMALQFELERALSAATDRALRHVFATMRDPEYPEEAAKIQNSRGQEPSGE